MDNSLAKNVADNYTSISGNSDTSFIYNLGNTSSGQYLLKSLGQNLQQIQNSQLMTTEQHGIALNSMLDQLPVAQNNISQNINAKTIGGGGSVGQIINQMNTQDASQEVQMGMKTEMQNNAIESQKQSWANNVNRLQYGQV